MPIVELTSDQIAERAKLIRKTDYLATAPAKQNGSVPNCRHCRKPRRSCEFVYGSCCEDCFADSQIGKRVAAEPRLRTGNVEDRHQK